MVETQSSTKHSNSITDSSSKAPYPLQSHPAIAFIELNLNLECLSVNDSWFGFSRLDEPSSLKTGWLSAFREGDQKRLRNKLPRSIQECANFTEECEILDIQGNSTFVRAHTCLAESTNAVSPQSYLLFFYDITDLLHRERQLQNVAQQDPLTGLLNRSVFYERMELALEGVGRLGSVALMFIDLDGFKQVNDRYGHDVGDALLKEVAYRLRQSLRKVDILARVGGDEFNILLTNVDAIRNIVTVANKILASLSETFHLQNRSLHISCSIGIAVAQDADSAITSLIKQADTALYKAKHAGKNQFTFFTSELNRSAVIEAKLRSNLALQDDHNLQVVYQPQVDSHSGEVLAIEALARWEHPELGPISADTLIKVAEDAGLINTISDVILNLAFEAASTWHRRFRCNICVAINISARQLRNEDLPVALYHLARRHGLSVANIILEINEQTIYSAPEIVQSALVNLNRMGFQIALDDFGTGYSSLSHLRTLPLNIIKIDHELTHTVLDDPINAKIVAAIIDLANALDLQVVAEGVETASVKEWLQKHGCTVHQGHFHCSALEKTKLLKWISNTFA